MALCAWTKLVQSSLSLFFLTLLFSLLSPARGYFIITQPKSNTVWANGSPFPITWTKGTLDGIPVFDIEITSLTENGLYYVARNVPATFKSLNVLLENVPDRNDYFVVCLNSTNGVIHSVSNRFTITNSSLAHSNPSPHASVPTATVIGPANPTSTFNLTIGPTASGAASLVHTKALGLGALLALCAIFLGGALTLW